MESDKGRIGGAQGKQDDFPFLALEALYGIDETGAPFLGLVGQEGFEAASTFSGMAAVGRDDGDACRGHAAGVQGAEDFRGGGGFGVIARA